MPRVVDMAEGSPGAVQNGLSDLMYLSGKAIHVSRREGKAFKRVLGTPLGGYRRNVVEVQQHTAFPLLLTPQTLSPHTRSHEDR